MALRLNVSCSYYRLKFTLEQAMKAQRGSRVQMYSFFNHGARWGGWSTPRPGHFTSGKETRYPLCRGLCGPQGRSVPVPDISPPTGIQFPYRSDRSELLYWPRSPCPRSPNNVNRRLFSDLLVYHGPPDNIPPVYEAGLSAERLYHKTSTLASTVHVSSV